MSSNVFWARVDEGTGVMTEHRHPSEFPADYNPRNDGWEQLLIPLGRTPLDVLGYNRQDGIIFVAYVREWDQFKDALGNSPRFLEVLQAISKNSALGNFLNLFISSIDSLIRVQSKPHLIMFLRMWTAFKGAINAATEAGDLQPGVVDAIEAIAQGFNIQLELPEE